MSCVLRQFVAATTVIACGTFPAAGRAAALEHERANDISRLETIPVLSPLVQAGYFSSYDRTGGNDDGFKGTWSSLRELPNGEHVIVDLQGPGCLYSLWFTGPDGGYSLPLGRLRFYLNDEPEPRLDCPPEALFAGEVAGFRRPLVANSFISTGGNVSQVPVPFEKHLVITTQNRAGFYNAYYHLFPPGTSVRSWTAGQDLSAAIAAWNAPGEVHPPSAGEERIARRVELAGDKKWPAVELANVQGSGTIRGLSINPAGPQSAFVLNNTWLRIFWDGEKAPSVDVPIGPFFGSGQGEGCVRALPIGMSTSGPYYCRIPMPFDKSARIELQARHAEQVGEVYCEIDIDRSPRADAVKAIPPSLRFHASWRREWPTTADRDFTILDQSGGQGLYLGHTLIIDPYAPDNKQWWEGDLRIWTDHRRHPILQGTGHEDELLGGWSSRWLNGPYSLPLHGLPVVKLFSERADSQWNGAMSGYRFFAGGIPFREGIRVSTEHGTNNKVVTNYAAVAYYYHSPTPAMTLTDSLEFGKPDEAQSHQYAASGGERCERTAVFEAEDATGTPKPTTLRGRSSQSSESFTLKLDPQNGGVLLRRVSHQGYGRHTARLSVNGAFVQVICAPESPTVDRWREQDIILPPSLTAGKDRLDIRIESTEGTWNSFGYQAYSLASRHP